MLPADMHLPYGLSLWTWIFILISISISIMIAIMSSAATGNYSHLDSTGSPLTAAHHLSQKNLPIVDRILEFQTVVHFLEFLMGGQLPVPNATEPTAAHITEDEMAVLAHSSFPLMSSDESIVHRVTNRIGSEADNSRLTIVGKNIHHIKTRIWEGILPMTEERWAENKLYDTENFDLACHHLSSVVAAFQYLNEPAVRCNLRDTFNLIHDEWKNASEMLNNERDKLGLPHVDLSALWTLYMANHYSMMTERAHRWVIDHIKKLRVPLMAALKNHVPIGEENGDRLKEPDATQWKLTTQLRDLLELAANADYTIVMPMDGYHGHVKEQAELSESEARHALDWRQRGKAYGAKLRLSSRVVAMQLVMEDMKTGMNGIQESSGEEFLRRIRAQVKAQDQIREEMRGTQSETPLREPWINRLLIAPQPDLDSEAGSREIRFAVYRLTHSQTDDEWAEFIKMFEEHSQNWGLDVTGIEDLKSLLQFKWIDFHGDLDGAIRHFNEMNTSGENDQSIEKSVMLCVDFASYQSYKTDVYTSGLKGFVLAISPEFDPTEGIERPDESPGYSGKMRILGNLVWCDLFAHLASQSAGLEDLWPLALDQPNQVYAGPKANVINPVK